MVNIHGGGAGRAVEVDERFRMETKSITRCDCTENSIHLADSFEFALGDFLTLANDVNEHGVFYMKNTSTTKALLIHEIRTCGTATIKWRFYKNDTGGTLLSEPLLIPINHNFNSTRPAEAVVNGANSASTTRSGGAIFSQHIDETGHSDIHLAGSVILGTNDSLTLTAQAKVAAADNDVCIRIHAYYEVLTP